MPIAAPAGFCRKSARNWASRWSKARIAIRFLKATPPSPQQAETEFTAFYLTDFLVRQFDAFVWRPMGLDRHPELRDMYFGNYTKLVYQAQTDDPALDAKAAGLRRAAWSGL